MKTSNSLSEQLGQIGLRALPAQLDDFLARAAKARWSPHQLLEEVVRAETAERSRRSLERRLRLNGVKNFSLWRTSIGLGPHRSNPTRLNALSRSIFSLKPATSS